jgi:TRAP transporter TAXI family solute receptor
MAFCHGSIQAMVHIGVHPVSKFQHLLQLCDAAPVDMDDSDIAKMVDGHPAFLRIRIPAQTYPALGKPISTFGTTVSLIASGSMDEQTVYEIMGALDKHQQIIQHAHPALGSFKVKGAQQADIGVSRHPGAVAYLTAHESK